MSSDRECVFFYGLFMDEALLASKGIRATNPAIACIEGFRLEIGERATLLPDASSSAHGVIMHMRPEDTRTLYADPGVADYVAEPVVVTLQDGVAMHAVCYKLPAEKLAGENPEYAKALLALATKLNLPQSYLEHIESLGAAD